MPIATVLIEDNKTIRDSLIPTMKELADLEVVAIAETSREGIQALALHDWQLAVIDLFLRHGSGMEVLRACGARRPDQHLIVLTNYATRPIRERCLSLGATAVFDKSTELEDFFDFCRDLFAAG